MAPRLSGQTSIFSVVFFVSKSLLEIEGQKKVEKFAILTRKPRSHVSGHVRILMYRTWPTTGHFSALFVKSPRSGEFCEVSQLNVQAKKMASGRGGMFLWSKFGQKFSPSRVLTKTFLSEMEVKTFVGIKKVIWDQLLATKAKIIQS